MGSYHHPKPFFRPKKNRWYVQLNNKHINLGPDEEAALLRYHQLMAERVEHPKLVPTTVPAVAVILDDFLEWLTHRVKEGSKAVRTFDWYKMYLQKFVKFRCVDFAVATLTVDQLVPHHVYTWVDAHPGWNTGKRGAMTAVYRAFAWAAKAGKLKAIGNANPLKGLERPQQGRRNQLISPTEYQKILALVKDRAFKDVLELSWATGARPAELFAVRAEFVDLERGRWVFPVKESKGKKYQRVVYLNDVALAITQRLISKYPSGILLRNTDGKPWCASAVSCRFQRIRDKLGVKYSLYAFRHAFCTHALMDGLDAVTVAELMGHRDTTMISRHYAHLAQRSGFLRDAVNRARPTIPSDAA